MQGGYGRQRMFASVGWGGASPLAGAAVARIGLQAAFSIYLVIGLLVFLPTCLLPIGILSAAKKADGSGTAGKGGGDGSRTTGELAAEGSAPKFEDSGSGSEAAGEIESLEVGWPVLGGVGLTARGCSDGARAAVPCIQCWEVHRRAWAAHTCRCPAAMSDMPRSLSQVLDACPVAQVTRRANSVGLLSPQERRARMDSDIASRVGGWVGISGVA